MDIATIVVDAVAGGGEEEEEEIESTRQAEPNDTTHSHLEYNRYARGVLPAGFVTTI